MAWPMIAAAAISVIGGAMQGRSQEKAKNKEIAASKEIARIQGQEERRSTAYQAELADYYAQLNTQRRRNARASMYDKYSLVQKPADFVRADLVGAKPVSPDATGAANSPLRGQRTPSVVPTGPLANQQEP